MRQEVPVIPLSLESRVLAAVHRQQQLDVLRLARLRWAGFVTVALSTSFLLLRLWQTGTPVIIETLLQNHDVLTVSDAAWALLESLPLGSLATVLLTSTVLCFVLSLRKNNYEHHTLSVV